MVRADALAAAVLRYRVMAYVTGVVLIVLCFAGIPLQVLAHNATVANDVGVVHGILYIIYLAAAVLMIRQVGVRLGSPQSVLILLAGTIPILTFVVERWVARRFVAPALAAARAQQEAPAGPGRVAPTRPGPS